MYSDNGNDSVKTQKVKNELNARSIVRGVLIGVVILCLSIYLITFVGMSINVAPLSAFMGIILIPIIGGKASRLEVNMVQTIASGVEAGSYGMVTSFAAITLFGGEIDGVSAVVILLVGSIIGISFISIFRKTLCEDETLAFPNAVACKNVIDKTEAPPKRDMKLFLMFLLIGLVFSLNSNMLGIIPNSISLAKYLPHGMYLDIALMPLLIGVGYLVGFEVSIVLMISALVVNLVYAPIGTSMGWFASPGENYSVMQQFNLSLMIGIALAGSVYPMVKNWRSIAGNIKVGKMQLSEGKEEVPPKLLYLLMGIGIVSAMVLFKLKYDINPFFVFITIIGMMLLSFVSIKVNAQTGMGVSGIMDMLTIFIVVSLLGDPVLGLMIVAMGTTISCMSGDMICDFKTGQLVGSSPQKQFIGQCIGLLPGIILAAVITKVLISLYGVGTPEAPFPYANMFYGLAGSASGGGGMISYARLGIGGIIGVLVSALGLPAAAMSLTLYLTPGLIIMLGFGGIIRAITEKRKGGDIAALYENAASGLIVGDSLIAVVTIFTAFFR